MSKRAVAAALWFASVWFGYEIVWSLTGIPRLAGPIIAFAIAAIVTVDPKAVFWPRSTNASSTRALDTGLVAPR